jgi:hypothetical protein
MAITPSTFAVEAEATLQFSQTGIVGARWGIREGGGSIDSNGLYSASGGSGAVTVRAMSNMWSGVDAQLTENADNSITCNTAGNYYRAYSGAALTAAGDQVEFIYTTKFFIGVRDATSAEWISSLGVLYYSVTSQYTCSPALVAGDRIAFIRIGSNQMGFKVNGTLVHTFAQTISGSLQPFISSHTVYVAIGDIMKAPFFSGGGVTGYSEATATGEVLPILQTPRNGYLEGYYDPHVLSYANGGSVPTLTDLSPHARHMTCSASHPTFHWSVLNGRHVVRWSGSSNPLKHTTTFALRCGWIVAKFDGTSLSAYQGLLSSALHSNILISQNTGTNFLDNGVTFQEFRSNERIYPMSSAPAPLNAFRVIFFRFWTTVTMDGLQLGQERDNTSRKFDGDVALLSVYSGDFPEDEIQQYSQAIADHFALTIAENVYPYQPDVDGVAETPTQTINIYDPPEGERIIEAIDDCKLEIDLKFSIADQSEVNAMRAFHAAYYQTALPMIYRDYRSTPPIDREGYIDGAYELAGSNNIYSYSFPFRER